MWLLGDRGKRWRSKAETERRLAIRMLEQGRSEDAYEHSNAALALIRRLRAREPDDTTHDLVLAGLLYTHAAILDKLVMRSAGVDAARESLALYAGLGGGVLPADIAGAVRGDVVRRKPPDDLSPLDLIAMTADVKARLARLLAHVQGQVAAEQIERLGLEAIAAYVHLARHRSEFRDGLVRVQLQHARATQVLAAGAPREPSKQATPAEDAAHRIHEAGRSTSPEPLGATVSHRTVETKRPRPLDDVAAAFKLDDEAHVRGMQRALELYPAPMMALFRAASPAEIESIARALEALDDDLHKHVFIGLGRIHGAQGQLDWAEACFALAAARTRDPLALYLRAQVSADLRGRAYAEPQMQEAADAGNPLAQYDLGGLCWGRGEHQRAEAFYRQADSGGIPMAAVNLGALLRRQGRLEEAEALYRRAAARGERDAMHNLGNLLRQCGRLEEAEQWFRKAIDAGSVEANVGLACLMSALGQASETEALLDRAAEAGSVAGAEVLTMHLLDQGRAREAEKWAFKIARHWRAGESVPETTDDLTMIEAWLRPAADAGNQAAQAALRRLRPSVEGSE